MSENTNFLPKQRFFIDRNESMAESSFREESVKNLSLHANLKLSCEDALVFFASYQLLQPTFPLQELKKSEQLAVKSYKESVYYGELLNGKKHGRGIMIYKNQKIFQGEWYEDKKKGKGSEKFPNKCFFSGNYENGKPNGKGFYQWSNGQTYQGEWKEGQRYGYGYWKGVNGDQYQGQWKNGKPDGSGTYISKNGDIYEGEFRQSYKNGVGVQKFANGDMYRGRYINSMPSGEGTYYWADGSYFRGNFLNGMREGKGIWKKGAGDCDKYEGLYKNDKKWGYGEFTWKSGNTYKGNYEGDVRSGYGEMFWTNGTIYKGQWVNGVQHGEGEIFIPEQGMKKAFFQNNKIVQIFKQTRSSYKKHLTSEHSKNLEKNPDRALTHKSFRTKQKNYIHFKDNLPEKNKGKKQTFKRSTQKEKKNRLVDSQTIYDEKTSYERSQKRVQLLQYYQKNSSNNFKKDPLMKKDGNNKEQRTTYHPFLSLDIGKNDSFRIKNEKKAPISKQRILHSSFYLYKLNQRIHDNPTMSNRNSPKIGQKSIER